MQVRLLLIATTLGLLVAPGVHATPSPSGLRGTVTRGPITPACVAEQPCSEPARNVTLVFFMGNRVTGRTITDAAGRYRIRLAPGPLHGLAHRAATHRTRAPARAGARPPGPLHPCRLLHRHRDSLIEPASRQSSAPDPSIPPLLQLLPSAANASRRVRWVCVERLRGRELFGRGPRRGRLGLVSPPRSSQSPARSRPRSRATANTHHISLARSREAPCPGAHGYSSPR